MSILYPSDNLLIMDYNRVIKSLNGMENSAFMQAIEKVCAVTPLPGKATPAKGTFNMLLGGNWYNLEP